MLPPEPKETSHLNLKRPSSWWKVQDAMLCAIIWRGCPGIPWPTESLKIALMGRTLSLFRVYLPPSGVHVSYQGNVLTISCSSWPINMM